MSDRPPSVLFEATVLNPSFHPTFGLSHKAQGSDEINVAMVSWKSLLLFSGLASASVAVERAGATLLARADAEYPSYERLADCPGYSARNVQKRRNGLTADLKLAGKACNAYGKDLKDLTLEVTYESGEYTTALTP